MGKYFGTDGIRGEVDNTLTKAIVKAIGLSLKSTFDCSEIVVAKDTRESGAVFVDALSEGAMACGIDVFDAGVLPTPALAFYAYEKGKIGIMVTASHNPYTDNGIKIFNQGKKLSVSEEAEIEAFIDGKATPSYAKFKAQRKKTGALEEAYKSLYKPMMDMKVHVSMALDMAHGATYAIAPAILSPLVDEVQTLNCRPDGRNINKNCGSTHLDYLKTHMIENKLDIGFAFDGDGDRTLAIDHQGRVIDGDLLIYVLAIWLKKHNALNKNTVVLTKMSNPGIIKALETQGIKVIKTDVGDKYVMETLLDKNLSLGGENSGHIIMPKRLPTGDGIFIAAHILRIIQEEKQSLAQLIGDVHLYPQATKNVKNVDKTVCEHPALIKVTESLKAKLPHPSLVLIRPSGTEPVVRITVSTEDEAMMQKTIETLTDTILKYGRDHNET